MNKIQVGQVWRHVGFKGVPASGLRLKVERVEGSFFWASYPDHPPARSWNESTARYGIDGFRGYELEASR